MFFARWTAAHVERGAQFLLSIGAWGTGTTPPARNCIGLECRISDGVPGFMIVDAAELPWSDEILGTRLSREAVMSQPLRDTVGRSRARGRRR